MPFLPLSIRHALRCGGAVIRHGVRQMGIEFRLLPGVMLLENGLHRAQEVVELLGIPRLYGLGHLLKEHPQVLMPFAQQGRQGMLAVALQCFECGKQHRFLHEHMSLHDAATKLFQQPCSILPSTFLHGGSAGFQKRIQPFMVVLHDLIYATHGALLLSAERVKRLQGSS
uniref:Uncharacterized protein n=1 Tax=mine drainage metagenome TaxID=410659 RepID=E6QFW3_9ZZZZ